MTELAPNDFDPLAKENQLRYESAAWDTSNIEAANPGDIPVIDLSDYFHCNSESALEKVAAELNDACTNVGFCSIIGHQFPKHILDQAFVEARRFHALDTNIKQLILMDRDDWPLKGVGYLPVKNRKLPARDKGNLNESIVFKRDHIANLDENQWPPEQSLPGFRQNSETYADEVEALSKRLLPIYARALKLDANFFNPAFTRPLYRMRLSHYPPIENKEADEFGIAPHVDTTFFTILAQNSPGLVIYSEPRQCWVHAPVIENAFIVNNGELLKQWSNDYFISVKHFANNNAVTSHVIRYPFSSTLMRITRWHVCLAAAMKTIHRSTRPLAIWKARAWYRASRRYAASDFI